MLISSKSVLAGFGRTGGHVLCASKDNVNLVEFVEPGARATCAAPSFSFRSRGALKAIVEMRYASDSS